MSSFESFIEDQPLFNRTSIRGIKLIDIYAVFLIYILPSNFLALISADVFYVPGLLDLEFITLVLTIPFFFIYWKHYTTARRMTSVKLLLLVVVFVILRFGFSIGEGIPISETIAIFRKSFYTPIACFALVLYFQSLSLKRIFLVFYCLFVLFLVHLILYLINSTGFPLFPDTRMDVEIQGGIEFIRTISGFPLYYQIFISLFLVKYLTTGKARFIIWIFLGLIAAVISATRSIIATTAISIFLIAFFFILKKKILYIKRFQIFSLAGFMIVPFLIFFGSNIFVFLINKFNHTINFELVEDVGTYAFRERVVESAFESVTVANSKLWGNGYMHSGNKGEYDLSMTTDTHLAPVIFTEGVGGLIIRILPIVYFFFLSLNKKSEKLSFGFRVVILSTIIANSIAYMQSSIFHNYNSLLFLFYVFEITYKKLKQYEYTLPQNNYNNGFVQPRKVH